MDRVDRRTVLTVVVAVQVVLAILGWRDLSKRTDEQVRGPKLLWRILMAINPGNSMAYWVFGRRRVAAAD